MIGSILLLYVDASIPFLLFNRNEIITSNSCDAKFFMIQEWRSGRSTKARWLLILALSDQSNG